MSCWLLVLENPENPAKPWSQTSRLQDGEKVDFVVHAIQLVVLCHSRLRKLLQSPTVERPGVEWTRKLRDREDNAWFLVDTRGGRRCHQQEGKGGGEGWTLLLAHGTHPWHEICRDGGRCGPLLWLPPLPTHASWPPRASAPSPAVAPPGALGSPAPCIGDRW